MHNKSLKTKEKVGNQISKTLLLENWLDEQNFSNVSERLKIQNSVASECKLNVTLLLHQSFSTYNSILSCKKSFMKNYLQQEVFSFSKARRFCC